MTLRIVRLGGPRHPEEGLRLGTVRRPPRGVPRKDWARRHFFDVWFPELAPSETLLRDHRPLDEGEWKTFARRFRAEMKAPQARHALELLAALSQRTNLSVGCYCEDEARCHRSVLRVLLAALGADVR